MTRHTQPLRDEHRELAPHLEHLLALADQIEPGTDAELVQRIGQVHAFLTEHLLDHAYVEEQALYPVVARTLGSAEATATMRRDHVEIGRLVDELAALRAQLAGPTVPPELARALRRVLYGLHAIVRLHFAKEEELYLTLLDERLSAGQARELLEAVQHASHAG
jgi:iron-sulfur cluster repair protein YtfE (RIC family)